MAIAFTQDEFFAVFASYNRAVWPGYFSRFTLAAGAVVLAFVLEGCQPLSRRHDLKLQAEGAEPEGGFQGT